MTARELIARAQEQLDRDADILAIYEETRHTFCREDWIILQHRRQYLRELELMLDKEDYYNDNETAD